MDVSDEISRAGWVLKKPSSLATKPWNACSSSIQRRYLTTNARTVCYYDREPTLKTLPKATFVSRPWPLRPWLIRANTPFLPVAWIIPYAFHAVRRT